MVSTFVHSEMATKEFPTKEGARFESMVRDCEMADKEFQIDERRVFVWRVDDSGTHAGPAQKLSMLKDNDEKKRARVDASCKKAFRDSGSECSEQRITFLPDRIRHERDSGSEHSEQRRTPLPDRRRSKKENRSRDYDRNYGRRYDQNRSRDYDKNYDRYYDHEFHYGHSQHSQGSSGHYHDNRSRRGSNSTGDEGARHSHQYSAEADRDASTKRTRDPEQGQVLPRKASKSSISDGSERILANKQEKPMIQDPAMLVSKHEKSFIEGSSNAGDRQVVQGMQRHMKNWNKPTAVEHNIAWPPAVIIENLMTGYSTEEKKWDGLKTGEIRSCLMNIKDLEYRKVLPDYDMFGHCGSALVVFAANEAGFINADTLHQLLQLSGRGRKEWLKLQPRYSRRNGDDLSRWMTTGLVDDEGKRVIYGYMVEPSDLRRLKHKKMFTVQSYKDMVLNPWIKGDKENEVISKRLDTLKERAELKSKDVEAEVHQFARISEELEKKKGEIEHVKAVEEEAERLHQLKMEDKRIKFEAQKNQILKQSLHVESVMKDRISSATARYEQELKKYDLEVMRLDEEEKKEKKEQELRMVEFKKKNAMRKLRLESDLSSKMMKKQAQLEERLNKELLDLQAKHHKEMLELKDKLQKEKQGMLQKKLIEQQNLQKDIQSAKAAAERAENATEANTEGSSCIQCHKEFSSKLCRVIYKDCGHMNVCINCSEKYWRRNKICPVCRKKQSEKFVPVPYKIFC